MIKGLQNAVILLMFGFKRLRDSLQHNLSDVKLQRSIHKVTNLCFLFSICFNFS